MSERTGTMVIQATLNMVQVRLTEMSRVEEFDPLHMLSVLSSMRSVLAVLDCKSPNVPEVLSTLGLVKTALSDAARAAHDRLRTIPLGELVH